MEPYFLGSEPTPHSVLDDFTPEQLNALDGVAFDDLPECVQRAYEEFATGPTSLLGGYDLPQIKTGIDGGIYIEAHGIRGLARAPSDPSTPVLDELDVLEFVELYDSPESAPPIGSTAYGEPLLDITARF